MIRNDSQVHSHYRWNLMDSFKNFFSATRTTWNIGHPTRTNTINAFENLVNWGCDTDARSGMNKIFSCLLLQQERSINKHHFHLVTFYGQKHLSRAQKLMSID